MTVIAQQNLLLIYTYLVLKKYSSAENPLNAAQVASYMVKDYDVSQKLDRRTIYAHFADLQKLATSHPEEVNYRFYRQTNGAAYIELAS